MNKNLLTFLIVACILGGVFITVKLNNPAIQSIYIDSPHISADNESAETDVEEEEEDNGNLIDKGIEVLKIRLERKRLKDSIRTANRKKFWAYQIGVNRRSPHDFEPLYKALHGKVPNIYIFKEASNSYFLIKNDGYATQEELIANHDEVETALHEVGISERAIITNLTNFCDFKDEVKLDGEKKVGRKGKVECLVCD